ncbi:MAG: hypothetical protein PHX21_03770 [bacterium]|nr:hypothetical protein [bacterium]
MNAVNGVNPVTYHTYSTEEAMKPPEIKTQTTRTEETSGARIVNTGSTMDFGRKLTNTAKQAEATLDTQRMGLSEINRDNNNQPTVKPVMYKGLGSVIDIKA